MNEPTIPTLLSNNVPWSGAAALITPEPWVQDAACASTAPDLFFPEKNQSAEPARKICLGCDVLEQCFEYALRTNQTSGVWGGHSERQLARIRRTGAAA